MAKLGEKGRIRNKNYLLFLKEGIIETISEDKLAMALENIKGRHVQEGRALLIALYYTGARPNEVLQLKGLDIEKEGTFIKVKLVGSKGGLPRTLFFPLRRPMVKELWQYCQSVFPDTFLFFDYRGNTTVRITSKKGVEKLYTLIANKLPYYFKTWFKGVIDGGISPYFLRHNRFSIYSANGASMQEMRMLKGSRTEASVMPYLHMSSRSAKSLARKL